MADLAELELRIKSVEAEVAQGRLDMLTKAAARLEAKCLEMMNRLREADSAAGNLGRTTANTAKDTDRLGNSAGRSATSLFRLAAGFGAIVAARRAISTVVDFDDTMAQLRGVAISTTASLEEQAITYNHLREAAKAAAETTRFSANESAQGLLELARAGLDADKSIRALPSVLNLAQGGLIGVDDAATTVVNGLAQFRLGVDQTERIVNVLVKAANNSTTSVAELAASFKFAGTITGGLGISVEQTAAALEILANAGLRGAQGGTVLRGVITQLLKPTKDARDALHQMGLTTKDVNPATNSLATIFERLRASGLNAENSVRIFNQRTAAGALALVNAGDKLTEYEKQLLNVGNEAQRLADIQNQTLGGSWDRLVNTLSTFAITLGEAGITSLLRGLISIVTGVVGVFIDLVNIIKDLVLAIPGVNLLGDAFEFLFKLAKDVAKDFHEGAKAIHAWSLEMRGVSESASDAAKQLREAAEAVEDLQTKQAELVNIQQRFGAEPPVAAQIREVALKREAELVRELNAFRDIAEQHFGLSRAEVKRQEDVLAKQEAMNPRYARALEAARNLERVLGRPLRDEIKPKTPGGPTDTGDDGADLRTQAETRLRGFFDALARERNEVKLTNREKQVANELAKVRAAAIDAEVDNVEAVVAAYAKAALAIHTATDAEKFRQEVAKRLTPTADVLKNEAALLGLNSNERKIAIQLLEFEREAREQGVENVDDLTAAYGRFLRRQQELNDKFTLKDTLEETADAIERERQAIGLDEVSRESLLRVLELEQSARRRGIELNKEEIETLKDQVDALDRARRDRGIIDSIVESERAITRETEAYLGSEGTLEKRLRIQQRMVELEKLTAEGRDELARKIGAESGSLDDLNDKLEESFEILERAKRLERVAEDLAAKFSDAFGEILFEGGKWRDGMEQLLDDLIRETFQENVTRGFKQAFQSILSDLGGAGLQSQAGTSGGFLSDLFGSLLGSERGNVFRATSAGPTVVPFALGGLPDLISRPTAFPMRGGRVGVAGEAGDEGILPLRRDSAGRLGVQASGAGGNTTIVQVTQNITTPDAESFRRSSRQVAADTRGAFARVR